MSERIFIFEDLRIVDELNKNLAESVSQFVDCGVEVKHLQVKLGHEVLHLVYRVEDFNPLGVGVEPHLVWSRHGGDPTSEMEKGRRGLVLIYRKTKQKERVKNMVTIVRRFRSFPTIALF